jgi:hypothetical protein
LLCDAFQHFGSKPSHCHGLLTVGNSVGSLNAFPLPVGIVDPKTVGRIPTEIAERRKLAIQSLES